MPSGASPEGRHAPSPSGEGLSLFQFELSGPSRAHRLDACLNAVCLPDSRPPVESGRAEYKLKALTRAGVYRAVHAR